MRSSEKSGLLAFWRIAKIFLTRKRACLPKSQRDEGRESKRVPELSSEEVRAFYRKLRAI